MQSVWRAWGRMRARPIMLLLGAGCAGPQSALDPAGRDAEAIATLFGWMALFTVVVWTTVMLLAVYAIRLKRASFSERAARALILGGGVALPTVVLFALLVYGLSLMPDLLDPGPGAGPRIAVSGEQWWWRVRYTTADGRSVELANELALPVGQRLVVELSSPDVIHSFWVPSLAGKMDATPGRLTLLPLEPTRTGLFRGACAEYCGASHAWMSFWVRVLEPEAFEAWLAGQMQPARAPASALARRGAALFQSSGCGACHAVRGTPADGVVGPDLTHVGGRHSLAAGLLGNDVPDFLLWLERTHRIKPEARMPAFHLLGREDLLALATYLDGLE